MVIDLGGGREQSRFGWGGNFRDWIKGKTNRHILLLLGLGGYGIVND